MNERAIKPELSAQGIRKTPNPMVLRSIERIRRLRENLVSSKALVVDQGCGQLRHLEIWTRLTKRIMLVDTKDQLNANHEFYGEKTTAQRLVAGRYKRHDITLLNDTEFMRSSVAANLIFCVNVFDVVPRGSRTRILKAAHQNLATDGIYVLIAPRNDTWTLRLCNGENRFQDGHVFARQRGYTFYKNWTNGALLQLTRKHGFDLLDDLSVFRHVCLLLGKHPLPS
jgi:hypothetical protein